MANFKSKRAQPSVLLGARGNPEVISWLLSSFKHLQHLKLCLTVKAVLALKHSA